MFCKHTDLICLSILYCFSSVVFPVIHILTNAGPCFQPVSSMLRITSFIFRAQGLHIVVKQNHTRLYSLQLTTHTMC